MGTRGYPYFDGFSRIKQAGCRYAKNPDSFEPGFAVAEDVGFEPTRGVNPARVPGV